MQRFARTEKRLLVGNELTVWSLTKSLWSMATCLTNSLESLVLCAKSQTSLLAVCNWSSQEISFSFLLSLPPSLRLKPKSGPIVLTTLSILLRFSVRKILVWPTPLCLVLLITTYYSTPLFARIHRHAQ